MNIFRGRVDLRSKYWLILDPASSRNLAKVFWSKKPQTDNFLHLKTRLFCNKNLPVSENISKLHTNSLRVILLPKHIHEIQSMFYKSEFPVFSQRLVRDYLAKTWFWQTFSGKIVNIGANWYSLPFGTKAGVYWRKSMESHIQTQFGLVIVYGQYSSGEYLLLRRFVLHDF